MYEYYTEREGAPEGCYTDLALERRRADTTVTGVEYKKEIGLGGIWERIKIDSEEGARSIGKPKGIYDTLIIQRMDLLDEESIDDAKDEISRELCYLCDVEEVIPEKVLVVGLGNSELTPDSVGAKSADCVKPTMHIKHFDERFFNELECSEIAVCKPGVGAKSGLDSFTVVKGISDMIKPDVIIAIDALASRSPRRLGTTLQLSNTGILPGSGLGRGAKALSKETLGVPVIAIGIPTVIDSRMFCKERTAIQLDKEYSDSGMFVSPKEIDGIVASAAGIIGGGINQAFGLFI